LPHDPDRPSTADHYRGALALAKDIDPDRAAAVEATLSHALDQEAQHPEAAAANLLRLASLKTVSDSEWTLHLTKMDLDGDVGSTLYHIPLPPELKPLIHIGLNECFSPAFIREFPAAWGAVSSRLGELFHLKEWKKYLGKDAPFVLNLMI